MTNEAESAIVAEEKNMSAEEFLATVTPMTATSGLIDILQELGELTGDDAILEVWCGGGDLTAQLADLGGRVVGADYSEKLIDAANRRFSHIEFVLSETVKLPFLDGEFDVAVSNFTAHHYSDPAASFMEMRRVLKDRGRLLVTIPIQSKRASFNLVLDVARNFLDLPTKVIKGGPLLDAEFSEDIMAVMRAAGFELCRGEERLNYTVLDSLDTLLSYAWKKIGLETAPLDVQAQIRSRSIEVARSFLHSDGTYRFPEKVLAVRADR